MTTQYEKGYNLGYAQCLQDLEGFLNGMQLTQELKNKNPINLDGKIIVDDSG